jgi:hypothetical protein
MDHLYWLSYHHEDRVHIVIQPGLLLMHARLKAALARLDEGRFTAGHHLDLETTKWIPPRIIGRRLPTHEAMKFLGNLRAG